MNDKSKLCYLQGIGLEYVDYQGKPQIIDQNIRDQLLIACGHELEYQAVKQANEKLDALPWLDVLPKTQSTRENNAVLKLRFSSTQLKQTFTWQLLNSQSHPVLSGESLIDSLAESGHYFYQNQRFTERLLPVENIAPDYYQLVIKVAEQEYSGQIICAPKHCYNPVASEKLWGVSVQLYSIKSQHNYGIGDFSDLTELIRLSANAGADYILLNPLHKLFFQHPERASPYSPSDRTQLNPLYISPKLSDDFQGESYHHKTNEDFIDYQIISAEKYAIFTAMFEQFVAQQLKKGSKRAKLFLAFKQNHQLWQLSDFDFYLQWQADEQLKQCQALSQQLQMKIGLMLDLAVGCSPEGEEYQRNQLIFADNVSIGAPPDPIALQGQNWGLPAPDPVKLKEDNYHFFIDLLRANMQTCGALRIDHVMGLLRLWWCVQYQEQQYGCYVFYPFDDLLAILALESHRNHCLIVGEDLGVVPPEVITNMAKEQLYGNDIFYFEKAADGQFKQPNHYRQQALLMIANHDVAPFYAWWQGDDIQIKNNYQLFTQPEQFQLAITERAQERQRLIQWLGTGDVSDASATIYQAVATKLASAQSTLFCLQIEDLEGNSTPVNIPGTHTEYPNWCRRLNQSLAKTFEQTKLFSQINLGRKNAKEQSSNHAIAT